MDIQSFIQSGLLEAYVLGQCSAEERTQVERMAAEHAEVRAELSSIEASLESFAADSSPHAADSPESVISPKAPHLPVGPESPARWRVQRVRMPLSAGAWRGKAVGCGLWRMVILTMLGPHYYAHARRSMRNPTTLVFTPRFS